MKGQIYEQENNEEEARETYKQGVWIKNKLLFFLQPQ
jgi:predicted negative regulator of RcsB-dependent stress response